MTYSVFLFVYVLLSAYIGEYVLIPAVMIFSYLGHLKIKLKSISLLYLFIVFISFFTSFFFYDFSFDLNLAIHLIVILLLTLIIRDTKFNIKHTITIIKYFLLFNTFLIIYDSAFNNFSSSFHEMMNVYRFKSIFAEPSVASFTFILIAIILYSYHQRFSIWLIGSLLFSILTFSGSAYLILVLLSISTIQITRVKLNKVLILVLILLFSLPSFFLFSNSEAFSKLVINRVERVQQGGDNSSKLRFLAPLQVIEYTLKKSPIFGFGLGASENVINQNRAFFTRFRLFDGEITSKINNSYAIILVSGGLLLLISHILLLTSLFKYQVNRKSRLLFIFLVIYPVFSGHFVHIFYWFVIYLILQIHYKNEAALNLHVNNN